MPRLDSTNMESVVLPGRGGYVFSSVRPDDLGATEYTLATILVDTSSSVQIFEKELLDTLKAAVGACKKSPRAENLLVRLVSFSSDIREIHGFLPLSSIDMNNYSLGVVGGMTKLIDATQTGVEATLTFAKALVDLDFDVNGIVFVITDGQDNSSIYSVGDVRRTIAAAMKNEEMESIRTVLVGVNDVACKDYLEHFKRETGIDQVISVGNVTEGSLAKLARFVSQSISSQSQSLGSGSPSGSGGITF
ncbi:MAG: hypothetical protein OEZ04_12995 [Nitrospinota bacterium]|nr:hypothetical protein [Nitrospinota bacterium]